MKRISIGVVALVLLLTTPVTTLADDDERDGSRRNKDRPKCERLRDAERAGASARAECERGTTAATRDLPAPPGITPPAGGVPATEPVGCGATATGGSGGQVFTVDTYDELRAAVLASGPRVVNIVGDAVLDGGGEQLSITRPAITIDGSGGTAQLKNAWIAVRTSNVILRHLRVRTGDAAVSGQQADAINLNGADNVLIDHVEAIWAPDVGGITILNDSDNVTVQHSIVGVGLTKSSHPESGDDPDGHNLAFNIAGQGSGVPDCVTVFRNLILHAHGRNPQVQGASGVDLVNNVIYNYAEAPTGNPAGLNLVNNIYRWGPATQEAGLGDPQTWEWKTRTSGDHSGVYSGSVYLAGNVADGFTFAEPNAPDTSLSAGPVHSLSVSPEGVDGLLDRVLAEVGPSPRDAITQRWVSETASRTGGFWNGEGQPGETPAW